LQRYGSRSFILYPWNTPGCSLLPWFWGCRTTFRAELGFP